MQYRTLIKSTLRSLPPSLSPNLKKYIISFYRVNLPIFHYDLTPSEQEELTSSFTAMLAKIYAQYQSPNQILPQSQLSLSYMNHNFIEINPKQLNLTEREKQLYQFYSRIQFFYLLATYKVFPKKFVGDKGFYYRSAMEQDGVWRIGAYRLGEGRQVKLYGPAYIGSPKKKKGKKETK